MKTRHIFRLIALSLFTVPFIGGMVKAQQEPMYSQYMFNMLHINPAYAGNRAADNVTLLYRSQWVGLNGSPKTGTLSWDRRQDNSNVGYGLAFYNDELGIEKTTGVQGFYSYHIPFVNSSLSLGISAGVLNYRAALSQTHPLEQGDPVFQNDIRGWLPTVGVGILYSTDSWYAGLSVPALLHTKLKETYQINESNFGANKHYFLTGGYIFNLNELYKLKPSVLVKSVSGAPIEFDFNINGWYNNFLGLGLSYRTGDAILGMLEIQLTPLIRLGYSYDYTISDLKSYNYGTHEILLRLEFGKKKDRILSPRYY